MLGAGIKLNGFTIKFLAHITGQSCGIDGNAIPGMGRGAAAAGTGGSEENDDNSVVREAGTTVSIVGARGKM
jgi:hypothetical protein